MKEVIKILIAGAGVGAAVTQIMNIAVWTWLDRPFSIGGEFIIPKKYVTHKSLTRQDC